MMLQSKIIIWKPEKFVQICLRKTKMHKRKVLLVIFAVFPGSTYVSCMLNTVNVFIICIQNYQVTDILKKFSIRIPSFKSVSHKKDDSIHILQL